MDTQRDGDGWRPTANADFLRRRAALLATTRDFFAARGVLEVQTQALSRHAVSTPEIESFRLAGDAGRFLRTSPEFAHKRLLAAGSGDIYELGPVFRAGESGRRHNPEFTLLEWYRLGFDHHALMDEVAELVRLLVPGLANAATTLSYAEACRRVLDLDVFAAGDAQLAARARASGVAPDTALARDQWLALLFATLVVPTFAPGSLTFVHGYPASQAALARLSTDSPCVAERFEAFAGGMELANGFHELADADEQRGRFAKDNARRRRAGASEIAPDEAFLGALDAGLPDCAGVAVGFDRLLMLAGGARHIEQTLAFAWDRA